MVTLNLGRTGREHSVVFQKVVLHNSDGTPAEMDRQMWCLIGFDREPEINLYYQKPNNEPLTPEDEENLALFERFAKDMERVEKLADIRFVILEQVLDQLHRKGVLSETT